MKLSYNKYQKQEILFWTLYSCKLRLFFYWQIQHVSKHCVLSTPNIVSKFQFNKTISILRKLGQVLVKVWLSWSSSKNQKVLFRLINLAVKLSFVWTLCTVLKNVQVENLLKHQIVSNFFFYWQLPFWL